jgi:carbon-monoxide dehydrogenase small subunit
MADIRSISLVVNGKEYERKISSRMTLADFLRHELELTGTHLGCEHGVCGACTVLLDGHSARGCLTLAVQASGSEVVTVEGLAAPDGTLSPLQSAFQRNHALQCGFCTPGILITLTLLRDNPNPSEDLIRDTLSGNLCRCTGYSGMVDAVLEVAAQRKSQAER